MGGGCSRFVSTGPAKVRNPRRRALLADMIGSAQDTRGIWVLDWAMWGVKQDNIKYHLPCPQAIKRLHRIGQTKEVTVEFIYMRDTVEEIMLTKEWAKGMYVCRMLDASV